MQRGALFLFVAVLAFGCESTPSAEPAVPGACEEKELLVAGSDNTRNSLVCAAPGCVAELGKTVGADLGNDPLLTLSNGRAFFLARDLDLVFELDPVCGLPLRNGKFSVGSLAPTSDEVTYANAHDAAAAPDGTVILPLYNAAKLAFVKDGVVEEPLDLAPYDIDGNPQAESVRVVSVNGVAKAFVALERLDDADRLRSTRPSQMLRLDTATRQVEAVIELAGRNPFNTMAEHAGALFLAEPGDVYAATDELAGIERFDTATSTTRILVGERALGASVMEVAVTAGCGVAIVAGPEPKVNPTAVVTFDPDDGRVLTTFAAPAYGPTTNYDLRGLAWRGTTLYVGDRRAGAGGFPVHVFEDKGGCTLVPAGRALALPQRPVALRPAVTR